MGISITYIKTRLICKDKNNNIFENQLVKAFRNVHLHIRCIRQNMEASIIALKRLSLNERVEFKKLLLFRNGVTR